MQFFLNPFHQKMSFQYLTYILTVILTRHEMVCSIFIFLHHSLLIGNKLLPVVIAVMRYVTNYSIYKYYFYSFNLFPPHHFPTIFNSIVIILLFIMGFSNVICFFKRLYNYCGLFIYLNFLTTATRYE